METQKKRTYKQDKAQPRMIFACGKGIEGLVLWGGALAFASLLAAFTIKKTRKDVDSKISEKPSDDGGSCKEEDDGSEGLRVILQAPPETLYQNSCSQSYRSSETHVAHIDTCESVSGQSIILEEKSVPSVTNGENNNSSSDHQEILLSDIEERSVTSSENCCAAEESLAREPDSSFMNEPQNMIQEESQDDLPMMEIIEIEIEDGSADAKNIFEENSPVQSPSSSVLSTEEEEEEEESSKEMSSSSMEEEQEDNSPEKYLLSGGEEENSKEMSSSSMEEEQEDNSPENYLLSGREEGKRGGEEEIMIEKGEESSIGTGSSSMEYDAEAIWSAEMIETFLPEPKERYFKEIDMVTKEIDSVSADARGSHTMSREVGSINLGTEASTMMVQKELLQANDNKVTSFDKQMWYWSILVLLLVILLASYTTPLPHLWV